MKDENSNVLHVVKSFHYSMCFLLLFFLNKIKYFFYCFFKVIGTTKSTTVRGQVNRIAYWIELEGVPKSFPSLEALIKDLGLTPVANSRSVTFSTKKNHF